LYENGLKTAAKNKIRDIIIEKALNLDELDAISNGFYSWYVAEQDAISCYQAF